MNKDNRVVEEEVEVGMVHEESVIGVKVEVVAVVGGKYRESFTKKKKKMPMTDIIGVFSCFANYPSGKEFRHQVSSSKYRWWILLNEN